MYETVGVVEWMMIRRTIRQSAGFRPENLKRSRGTELQRASDELMTDPDPDCDFLF